MGEFPCHRYQTNVGPQPLGMFSDLGTAYGVLTGATLKTEYKLLFGSPVNCLLS